MTHRRAINVHLTFIRGERHDVSVLEAGGVYHYMQVNIKNQTFVAVVGAFVGAGAVASGELTSVFFTFIGTQGVQPTFPFLAMSTRGRIPLFVAFTFIFVTGIERSVRVTSSWSSGNPCSSH